MTGLGVTSPSLFNYGRFVVQRFRRRASPMYRQVAAGTTLYSSYHPIWSREVGSWYDFVGVATDVAEPDDLLTMQSLPGTYQLRLDLFTHASTSGRYRDGVPIHVAVGPGHQRYFAEDAAGTVSVGIWGSSVGTDRVQVRLIGRNYHTELYQEEVIEVQSNEVGKNTAPPGGVAANAANLDFPSPWLMNVGSATDPLPRGWMGRWGSYLSEKAWRVVSQIKVHARSVNLTGVAHNFAQHPMLAFAFTNNAAFAGDTPMTPTTYVPEIFLHSHEPAFATPWPNATRRQLEAVVIATGASGLGQTYWEHPTAYYPIYSMGAARSAIDDFLPGGLGGSDSNILGLNTWVHDPDDALSDQMQGDIWGLVNLDDPNADSSTNLGDAPVLDVGSEVLAFWNPNR